MSDAAHFLSELVDTLVTAPQGIEPPAYLIQKNLAEAVLVLRDTMTALVLVAGPKPDEDLAARVQAALAAERPEVRAGVQEAVRFLILVCDKPPVAPPVPAGIFEVLAITRAEVAFLATNQPLQMKNEVPRSRERVLQELETARLRIARSTTALGPEQLARVEHEGESALAAEGVYAGRLTHPWGVTGLVLVAALVFVLQLRLGGLSGPVLVRMGANLGERVAAGEWYRVFTAGWLHIDFGHFLSNMVFLYVVGMFLEAALGTPRFIALYLTLLPLSEAAVAWMQPTQIGCGASGGVLGLIAALAVLSWRAPGIVPPISGQSNSIAATIYLLVQMFYSFGPKVSLTAHLAGAVIGSALIFLGVAQAGIPGLQSGAREPGWSRIASRAVATGLALVTMLAFARAFAVGRPADGVEPPQLVEGTLEPSHLTGRFPAGSVARMAVSTGADHVVYRLGSYDTDPLVISIIDRDHRIPDEDGETALAHMKGVLESDKKRSWSAPVIVPLGRRRAARVENRSFGVNLVRWVYGVGGREIDAQISWVAPASRDHEKRDRKSVV